MRLAATHHARWCTNVLLEKLIRRLNLLLLMSPVIPILPLLILQFILLSLNTFLHYVLHRAPVVVCLFFYLVQISLIIRLLLIHSHSGTKNANSISSSRAACNGRIDIRSIQLVGLAASADA